MARVFTQYLAIYRGEKLPGSLSIDQIRFKLSQKTNKTLKNCPKDFKNFPIMVTMRLTKVGNFGFCSTGLT